MAAKTPPLRTEVARLVRFGAVGGGATLLHLAIAEAALFLGAEAWLAFLVAFGPAFVFSYLGHRHFTFARGDRQSLPRFFAIALVGLAAGQAMVELSRHVPSDLHPALRLMLGAAVVPAATYFAAKMWAFREE